MSDSPPVPGVESARTADEADDDAVEAEIVVERAVERAEQVAADTARKVVFELRETSDPTTPDAQDLAALAQYPDLAEAYLDIVRTDLDMRWAVTETQQRHDHEMERKRLELQSEHYARLFALDQAELDTTSAIAKQAPFFALTFGLAALLVSLFVALYASPVAGAIIAGLDISTGIGLFLYQQVRDEAEGVGGEEQPEA